MTKLIIRQGLLGCLLVIAMVALSQFFAYAEYRRVNWEALDLSPTQQSEFDRLDQKWQVRYGQLAPRIRSNEVRLHQLMNSPNPDKNEIMRLQLEINADKAQLKVDATDIHFTKRKLLNADQQRELVRQMNASAMPASAAPAAGVSARSFTAHHGRH